jgi:EAL domain-containing protein (putative c-di-GMP-specific phosphodiesterase class I)
VQLREDNGISQTQVPIIRAVVALATDLDLSVIAEGVESLEEIERLQELNCQFAQGFAFGSAMSGAELGKRLATQFTR